MTVEVSSDFTKKSAIFANNGYQYYIAKNYFILKKKLLDEMSSLEKNQQHEVVSSL